MILQPPTQPCAPVVSVLATKLPTTDRIANLLTLLVQAIALRHFQPVDGELQSFVRYVQAHPNLDQLSAAEKMHLLDWAWQLQRHLWVTSNQEYPLGECGCSEVVPQ